jgi:hypothetical protein
MTSTNNKLARKFVISQYQRRTQLTDKQTEGQKIDYNE